MVSLNIYGEYIDDVTTIAVSLFQPLPASPTLPLLKILNSNRVLFYESFPLF
jgi:hypothetical protein